MISRRNPNDRAKQDRDRCYLPVRDSNPNLDSGEDMNTTSKKVTEYIRLLHRQRRKPEDLAACRRALRAGIEYTEEERKMIWQAASHLRDAAKIFDDIYADRIGKLVVKEARYGQ